MTHADARPQRPAISSWTHRAMLAAVAAALPGVAPAATLLEWDLSGGRPMMEKTMASVREWKSTFRAVLTRDGYVCRDGEGTVGYNQVSPDEVLRTKRGECAYLAGARWSGQPLAGAVLTAADLNGAVLRGAGLSRANLRGVKLLHAELDGAILDQARLDWADLNQAHLENSHAPKTVFANADMRRTMLRSAILDGAYFMDANLAGAFLVRAWIRGANFRGANLLGADFTQAVVDENTVFHGAKYDASTRLPFSDREARRRGMIRIGF